MIEPMNSGKAYWRRGIRRLAATAGAIVVLANFPAAARAADFPAEPSSLGAIPAGTSGGPTCAFGPPKDVHFNVGGLYGPVSDVAVTVKFEPQHNYVSDLSAILVAPDGASAVVFHRTGFTDTDISGADVAGPYTFADSATLNWWAAAASTGNEELIPAGSYRASTPGPNGGLDTLLTPTFAASNPNGTWTLRLADTCLADTGGVGAASLALTTEPPNEFTYGKFKRNTGKGTGKLTVEVLAPGTLKLGGKLLKTARGRAEAPGDVRLAVKPKGKAVQKLRETGKAKVKAEITFTPDGGQPRTQSKKLKLRRD